MVNCCGNYSSPRCFRVKRRTGRATLRDTVYSHFIIGERILILCSDTSTDRHGREPLWLFYYTARGILLRAINISGIMIGAFISVKYRSPARCSLQSQNITVVNGAMEIIWRDKELQIQTVISTVHTQCRSTQS